MKRSSFFCVFGLLVVLSLFVIYWPRDGVDSGLVDSPALVQSSERDDNQNAKVDAFKDRVRQVMQARPAREPNTYFDSANADPVYWKNYNRHRYIARFVNSPYRDHPESRKLMVLLLENGFDVSDWGEVAMTVSAVTRQVVSTRKKVEEAWWLSPRERDEAMAVAYKAQEYNLDSPILDFVYRKGIERDSDLFKSLFSVELPSDHGVSFTVKDYFMISGEPFLTDEDWMDEEFQAAKDRYRGPVRDVSDAAHRRRKKEWRARQLELDRAKYGPSGSVAVESRDGEVRILPPGNAPSVE